jgi:serine/threonine-protein kinase HipA
VARVHALAVRTPECFAEAARDEEVKALGSALPARLAERVATHAAWCQSALARD